ncbi:MAG: VWA domain-containing protein, partial [Pseudomonadota bacterium]
MSLPPPDGRLVDNIVHFTRALRKAGVKVGTAQVETAIEAVTAAGFSHRVDFYHVLRATLISRSEHIEIFHQVFSMFWRDPEFLDSLMHMMSPRLKDETPPPPPGAAKRRAEEALGEDRPPRPQPPREEIVEHAVLTVSNREVFKRMDFEQMSTSELAEAERAIRALDLPVKPLRTRRTRPHPSGPRPDARASLRRALRRGGEMDRIARKMPVQRPPDLVVICDISGSMSVYSRLVLRYAHALAHAPQRSWRHVHAFTFGTALTNVSRALNASDPDVALTAIGQEANDWEGGTRIGAALEAFNKRWARRVLSPGAVVLLVTDGLERGGLDLLDREAARLSRTARQMIWLNPLLRWDGFAPLAGGVATLLDHVDSFHACHSLQSLGALSEALGETGLRD